MRRTAISLREIRDEHREADSPYKVQVRIEEVMDEWDRVTFAYEAENNVEF